MILGILKEDHDPRVALVPPVAKKIKDLGIEICIEHNAAVLAGYEDDAFGEFATAVSRDEVIRKSDVIVVINKPDAALLDAVPQGKMLISSFESFMDDSIISDLKSRGLQALSMDMIPRTTLAQSMDVLSSMASIAGYRAVLLGASHSGKFFPMMITAAGSIKPSKVLIIGAGVAGLQAIATARRLGAVVEAFDTRSAVKEEVQSLGARFVEVEGAVEDAGAGGYGVQQSEEYMKRQRELVQEKARDADIIITTAQVRGRKAPVIIPADTVGQMKRGAVIVDLAASTGGNCELTKDEEVYDHNGVTIIGDSNLARGMSQDASFLYSNNLFHYLKHMMNEGELVLNEEDEIIASSWITRETE